MKKIFFILLTAFLAVSGLSIYFSQKYNQVNKKYTEEKVLFDGRFGEIVRLKDKIGAYQDSCRLYRRDISRLKDTYN
jgi:hypothetical protein